jgi:hypothetical protein
MKTRYLSTGGFTISIAQRTDGWYYRFETDDPWEGPYRNLREVVDEYADDVEQYLRSVYRFIYKEALR